MSSIPSNSINAYQAPLKSLSNEDYVDQAGAKSDKSTAISDSKSIPVFADAAVKSVITASILLDIAPDIPKGKIDADPVNFSKQMEQLHSTFSGLSHDQVSKAYTEAGTELAVLAQKSGFDITSIANGFSGRAAIGMASSGLSAGVQTKGLNNANKAIKVHGTKAVNLNRSADSLSAKASPGKRLGLGKENTSDVELLKKQPNSLKHDASIENMQQQMRANDAMRMQMHGQMLGQGGLNIATLSSSNGHVEKANADAKAQINKTDEGIFAARKDSDEREQQSIGRFKAELLQLLAQLLTNRSATISSMTNNIKG
ncbi:hypothetical protein [Cedecea sp. FDAARGOS_727]|uniref:hypothetical protein n=1 Tax=Cedecea sp. FDAARGOS_727 TaxID=2545798 RepID=UPI00143EC794|nr:hypothetical protein [Cedecea sp. FDAARGOS_727]QIX96598.1 hypothetical protein FOC35_13295 [Cedecea sp. FDAARGOS_727]